MKALFIALILAGIVPASVAHTNATVSQSSLPSWATGCQDWVTLLAQEARKKGATPQSTDSIPNNDTCAYLLYGGLAFNQFQEWQASFDTLKLSIERCPLAYQSWQAFPALGNDVSNLQNLDPTHDSILRDHYLRWIESVLYLNTTDPVYFCECVNQIHPYRNFTSDSEDFMAINGSVALIRWIFYNGGCDSSQEWADWWNVRKSQRRMWLDDSTAGIHYPYDTTIPPLSSLGYGLDTLLARHLLYAVVGDEQQNVPVIISNASASPNPVNSGTVISFTMNKEAYVKIQLYDVLGQQLGGTAFEALFQPGNKSVPISLAGLPPGTYYARLQTAYGEVQTVKLVKQ